MANKVTIPTKVITGVNTRWSYANVWDPKSINGGAPKYSVSLIIPKSDTATVAKIKAAIQAAYEEGQSKLKGNGKSVPALSAIKTPLRDGDLERPDDEAYKNSLLHQRQQRNSSRHRGCGQTADPGTFRSLLRRLRQGIHQPLRLQQQRQQGYRLRSEQPSEDPRR